MSTRACYRFFPLNGPNDWPGVVTVYKHHDGYPAGAATAIEAALDHAWSLPRFEPGQVRRGLCDSQQVSSLEVESATSLRGFGGTSLGGTHKRVRYGVLLPQARGDRRRGRLQSFCALRKSRRLPAFRR